MRRQSVCGWQVVRGAVESTAIEWLGSGKDISPPPDTKVLRTGNTRTTYAVPSLGIVKLLRCPGTREVFRSLFAPSSLTREYEATQMARELTGAAPEPVFVVERRTTGILRNAAIGLRRLSGTASLQDLLDARFPLPGRRAEPGPDTRPILRELGARLARLHKAGGVHGDPSPDNVLVRLEPPHRITLIDWYFALFAGAIRARNVIGRHLLARESAARFGLTVPALDAALKGFRRSGARSPEFGRLRLNDLTRMVHALVQCGTPTRELLRCLRGYESELGTGEPGARELIDTILARLARGAPRSIRRTLRNADRGSRRTGVTHSGRTTFCYLRSAGLSAVREALEGGAVAQVRESDAVLSAWRNACVFARFRLPARVHLGCRIDSRTGRGRLVLERPVAPFTAPAGIGPARLAAFVRLLHAFGFRFRTCQDDTVVGQAAALGPFAFRGGAGCVLDDAAAVEFAPEEATAGSIAVVAEWLRAARGGSACLDFTKRAARPLRLRL
jgi:hypothetical protein